MAIELEQTIMQEIGLGCHYNYFNGSGSCEYIRNRAIELLPIKMKNHGLTLSKEWANILTEATVADNINNDKYTLTITWITASYAIQDGIYHSAGDKEGIPATENHFHFFDKKNGMTINKGEKIMTSQCQRSYDALRDLVCTRIEEGRSPSDIWDELVNTEDFDELSEHYLDKIKAMLEDYDREYTFET